MVNVPGGVRNTSLYQDFFVATGYDDLALKLCKARTSPSATLSSIAGIVNDVMGESFRRKKENSSSARIVCTW